MTSKQPNMSLIDKLKAFNEKCAVKGSYMFGTMGMFWLLGVWAILPLIPGFEQYRENILYVSAGIIQLIALPLISVGNIVVNRDAEKQRKEDHEKLAVMTQELHTMYTERGKDQARMLEIIESIRAMQEDRKQTQHVILDLVKRINEKTG